MAWLRQPGRLAAEATDRRVPRVTPIRPRRRGGVRVHPAARCSRCAGCDPGRLRLRIHTRSGTAPSAAGQRRSWRWRAPSTTVTPSNLHLQGTGAGPSRDWLQFVKSAAPGTRSASGSPRTAERPRSRQGLHRRAPCASRACRAAAGHRGRVAVHRQRAALPDLTRCTRRGEGRVSAQSSGQAGPVPGGLAGAEEDSPRWRCPLPERPPARHRGLGVVVEDAATCGPGCPSAAPRCQGRDRASSRMGMVSRCTATTA